MFRTVRHWWGSGQGKLTLRLFVFEFLVVVAGVLVAQALANWVQDHADFSRMEHSRAAVREQIQRARTVALGWQKAVPCVDARMAEIMRLAAEGEPIGAAMVRRPQFRITILQLPEEADRLLIGQRYGNDELRWIGQADDASRNLALRVMTVSAAWSPLLLVDPANGPVSAADRADARRAAAAIRVALIGVRINARTLIDNAGKLAIPPGSADETRPIRDCAELWRENATHIDLPVPAKRG